VSHDVSSTQEDGEGRFAAWPLSKEAHDSSDQCPSTGQLVVAAAAAAASYSM